MFLKFLSAILILTFTKTSFATNQCAKENEFIGKPNGPTICCVGLQIQAPTPAEAAKGIQCVSIKPKSIAKDTACAKEGQSIGGPNNPTRCCVGLELKVPSLKKMHEAPKCGKLSPHPDARER